MISPSLMERMVPLVEGNPGAITVLAQLPRDRLANVMDKLEASEVRGCRIWLLYKDVCGEDPWKFQEAVEDMPGILAAQSDSFKQQWAFYH